MFKTRAGKTETALPVWGKALYDAVLASESTTKPFKTWLAESVERRFSIELDSIETKDSLQQSHKAASSLLALPWEILHDGSGYLWAVGNGIPIRRSVSGLQPTPPLKAKLPIRVLLLSPGQR